MANFKQGDVVRVPFPYTDRASRQNRPALVISRTGPGEDDALFWVAMITSAENRAWPGDVTIKTSDKAGLPAPSVIRTAKVATIEGRHADKLGEIDKATIASVARRIRQNLFGEAQGIESPKPPYSPPA